MTASRKCILNGPLNLTSSGVHGNECWRPYLITTLLVPRLSGTVFSTSPSLGTGATR